MTHKEFLNEVQKRSSLDRQHCSMLLKALTKVMVEEAIEQRTVSLDGLGQFISAKHPEYIQENPETGETIMYPPRYSYRFHSEVKL